MNAPVYPGDKPIEFIFVDFETFYSREYTLRDLDPPSYILDPRFEAICLGVAKGQSQPYLVDGPDIPDFLDDLPDNVAMVSHNALFDMCITSWRYHYTPRLIVDTLALARTLLAPFLRRLDLGSVAEWFGLQKTDTIRQVIGMSRADIKANGLWPAYTSYCLNDVALCRHIFNELLPRMPAEEIVLHDIIARCAVEPAFRLNMDVLAEHLGAEEQRKGIVFMKAMFAGLENKQQLMSNPQFAELLTHLGVDPPVKISPTTGRLTHAFSRHDRAFMDLLEHEDPRVSALVEARLSFKSTIEETRTRRMMNIGRLDFPDRGDGFMPIPLIVGAAHTHRLGGGWQLNCQNWGRKSPIRKSIEAPPGHVVMTADARQIEARMNAWFCGQDDLLEEFRRDEDVYANFASVLYGFKVTKDTHPVQRFVGKTSILQLGYQAGWEKYQATIYYLTMDEPDGPMMLSDFDAQHQVGTYRTRMSRISGMWRWLPRQFGVLAGHGQTVVERWPIKFMAGKIIGPTGLPMFYNNMRYDGVSGEWRYDYHGVTSKIYGGKMLENIIQYLARLVTMSAAVRLKKPLADYTTRLTHTSHDELVYIVPDKHVPEVKALIKAEMTRSPEWAASLPLAVDIGIGRSYGDAK